MSKKLKSELAKLSQLDNERHARQDEIKKHIDALRALGYCGGQENWHLFRIVEVDKWLGTKKTKAKGARSYNEAKRIFVLLEQSGEVLPVTAKKWKALLFDPGKDKLKPGRVRSLWTAGKCPSASSFIKWQNKYLAEKNKG